MRLTLRTLLAYLDDTLEPAEAKLVGQKVAEREAARELIERIKQVMRLRRLTAPPATGSGKAADSNTVAEYLDNILPAEQVTEVEQMLLGSDVHLAEVAACHQILTLFLGQPAQVPPTAKQRMYGLLKGRDARPVRKPHPEETDFDEGDMEEEEEDEALRPGLPQVPGRGSRLRRLAPVAGVVALIAVLAVAVSQLMKSRDRGRDTAIATITNPEDEAANSERELIAAPTPVDEPASASTLEKKDLTTAKVPLDKVPADTARVERRVVGKNLAPAAGPPAVLLRRATDKDAWQRVKPGGAISTGDMLVSLPGYRTDLQLDAGARVVLWGNVPEFSNMPVLESCAVLHVPTVPFDVDLTLDHGRIVLANTKSEGALRVKVRFHDEIWDLTLRDGEAVVGMELWGGHMPGSPFRKKPGGEPPGAVLDMLGLAGETDVKVRYQRFTLGSPMYFHWNNTGARSRAPQALPQGLPQWFTQPMPNTPQAKETSIALEDLGKHVVSQPVDVALTEMRKDGRGSTLVLSVLCLGAIDDLPDLVDCLQDERPEVRWAAVYTLGHWIGRKAGQDLKLYNALHEKNGYSVVQAETIMVLLHGFSEEQANIPETYEALIDYLRSDKLAIRELAWRHLLRLWPDGKAIRYDPAGPSELREHGYDEWKKKIPNGKLPPRGQAK